MKKVIFLLLIIITTLGLSSCTSDDDNPDQDQLIGKWKAIEYSFNGVENSDPCDLEGVFSIKSDGTFTNEDYESDQNDTCFLDETVSGTWTNNGKNSYSFEAAGETETYTMVFQGNTFSITEIIDQITIKVIYQRQ